MPTVSVIINCFNGARYLREAIESVFAQTYADWEIIFWDNASTDDSPGIAKSFGEKVRYFRSNTTTSLGQARNMAFSKASGDYIAILDADDIWYQSKLAQQIPLFRDNEVGLTYSNSQFFDNTGDLNTMFDKCPPARGYVFNKLLNTNFISSETMIYRHTFLKDLPFFFQPDLTMVMDFDLSIRIAYTHKLDYIDECLSKWRFHPESETSRKPFLVSRENKIMLERLDEQLPGYREKYPDDFAIFNRTLDFHLGLEAWGDGRVKGARHLFKKHGHMDQRHRMAYWGTFIYPFRLSTGALTQIKKIKNLLSGKKA